MRRRVPLAGFLLPVLAAASLLLTACGSKEPTPTPTLSVNAIFTAAFKTFTAQQATQKALTPPTSTPTNTPFPTLVAPPTLGNLPFGSPTSAVGGVVSAACDNSTFISETVPDGTSVDASKKFVKAWTLMNNGTCDWSTSYKLHFLDGDQMNGADTFVAQPVPVGQQIQISVSLVAPDTAGTYKGRWQMENAASQPFGSIIWVQVKVGAAGTDTPGATNTPGTPSPSKTPKPTATPTQ